MRPEASPRHVQVLVKLQQLLIIQLDILLALYRFLHLFTISVPHELGTSVQRKRSCLRVQKILPPDSNFDSNVDEASGSSHALMAFLKKFLHDRTKMIQGQT